MDEAEKNMGTTVLPVTSPGPSSDDAGLQALRTIRHDFKTPLTSLRILGQIFQTSLQKGTLVTQPERTERNCKLLIEQVDKLVALADNLYEISLAQSGRFTVMRQHADLRPIMQDALAKYSALVREVELPAQPVWGEWDVAKLTQAFGYLLSEAVSIAVIMRTEPNLGGIRITMQGDYRPMNDKNSPGRYIAAQIIEKHGGRLSDRFEIQLPAQSPAI